LVVVAVLASLVIAYVAGSSNAAPPPQQVYEVMKAGLASDEARLAAAEAALAKAQQENNAPAIEQAKKNVEATNAALDTDLRTLRESLGAGGGSEGLGTWGIIGIVFFVVLALIGLIVFWVKSDSAKEEVANDGIARVRLAKAVTLGAMCFIVLVSVVILVFAGINAMVAPTDAKTTQFFEIAKWIMATILPVVGAWVGAVLAYYFGKDNFQAATQSAKDLVQQLSPQQLLDSQKAGDAGLAISSATVYKLTAGAVIDNTKLSDLQAAFVNHERLPILDAAGCVQACLHRATLNKYIVDKNPDMLAAKLGELVAGLPWDLAKSFDTARPSDSLARVQERMKAVKECADIFVTADGSKTAPAQRWITNEDILKISGL
jgi:uncharacterized membrane protein